MTTHDISGIRPRVVRAALAAAFVAALGLGLARPAAAMLPASGGGAVVPDCSPTTIYVTSEDPIPRDLFMTGCPVTVVYVP